MEWLMWNPEAPCRHPDTPNPNTHLHPIPPAQCFRTAEIGAAALTINVCSSHPEMLPNRTITTTGLFSIYQDKKQKM